MNLLKRTLKRRATNKIRPLILFAAVALTLSSCVTAKRCAKKFPPVIERETIIKDSTIITERTKFDTIFQRSKDTVFLFDHETKIKIKYVDRPGDSVFVSAECPEDTITVRTHTITNNLIHEEGGPGGWFWVLIIFGVSALLFGLSFVIKQIKR